MIFCFSGTGNSRLVATRIAAQTGDTILSLNDRLRQKDTTAVQNADRLVFVTPTYAWRIPRVVENWIEQTDFPSGAAAYFVVTCGDGAGNAEKYVRKLCARKGFRFMGFAAVVMPENYIAMFDAPDEAHAKPIVERALPKADALGQAIAAGRPFAPQKVRSLDRVYSSIVNPAFYKFVVRAKGFRVTDACIGCGQCASVCPLENITLQDGKPVWGKTCTHCMACICLCPESAIEYGTKSVGQPRYRCPEADKDN